MPELALSIKRLPTGYILSPLKFSLLLLYLFCEQSGSFPEVKAAEPSQTRAYGSHCLVTGRKSVQQKGTNYNIRKYKRKGWRNLRICNIKTRIKARICGRSPRKLMIVHLCLYAKTVEKDRDLTLTIWTIFYRHESLIIVLLIWCFYVSLGNRMAHTSHILPILQIRETKLERVIWFVLNYQRPEICHPAISRCKFQCDRMAKFFLFNVFLEGGIL